MIVVLMIVLAACGANAQKNQMTEAAYSEKVEEPQSMAPGFSVQTDGAMEEVEMESLTEDSVASQEHGGEVLSVEEFTEKIIYTGNVSMETTDFDRALTEIEQAAAKIGGFVQDSSVSGRSSYDNTAVIDRFAFYTIRVPAEQFDAFMSSVGQIGNVVSSSRNATNVTSTYTDYEARLNSLRLQEERLLELLEQAGDLESLIALEARLSEVRYEIEMIERNLRDLDQQLAYSTVYIDLQEVEVYTQTVPVKRTFGQKMSDAFRGGWSDFGENVQNFAIGAVESLPSIILFLVIAGTVVVFIVRKVKKKKTKIEENKEES